MRKAFPHPKFFLTCLGIAFSMLSLNSAYSQTIDDLTISGIYTINAVDTLEVRDLHLNSDAKLSISGVLIVYGNVSMNASNTNPEFKILGNAKVIVFGDFETPNKFNISLESLLIVHGKFKNGGSKGHGDLHVENANIYLFGPVENWGDDFGTCDSYEGDSDADSEENCDYGTEEDYIDNLDDLDLPPQINCFNLSQLENKEVCLDEIAVFEVEPISNVSYEWQVKESGGEWMSLSSSTNKVEISPEDPFFKNGNKIRLVIRPIGEQTCKVAVSNVGTLTVKGLDFEVGPISEVITEVCPGTKISFSIPEVTDAVSYTWSLPNEWILESGQNSNEISVTAGNSSGEITVSITNSCGLVKEANLTVSSVVLGIWTGNISEDWNNARNWSCNSLPTSTTDVLIPAGLSNYPVLQESYSGAAKYLKIEAEASVIIHGSLSIAASIENSGRLQVPGTLIYNGSTTQSIAANTFEGNQVGNLVVDNYNSLHLEGPLYLSRTLEARNGDLLSNGHLTLLSDTTSKTALIKGSGNGEVLGTVHFQRYLNPAFGYKYFSSPFRDLKVGDFSNYIALNSDFPNFYHYKEDKNLEIKDSSIPMDASGWEKYTEVGNSLNVMEGYAVNFGEIKREITLEFSGEVNNGPYSRELKNTNGEYTKGFHLVGNPYPSPIDWDAAEGWTKENIDGAIHFFTASEDSQYTGTYKSYAAGVSSDGVKNSASNIIPSMQGFFVHVKDFVDIPVTIGTLGMTNKVRVVDFAQEFYKTSHKNTSSKSLIRLSVQYKDQHLQDPTVIYFDQGSKPNFDSRTDALKIMNTDVKVPNLYSLSSENKQLSINALPAVYSGEMRISLGLQVETSGEMILKLQDLEKFAAGTNVYLIDLKKRIARKLKEGFQYEFHTDKGIHNDRFELLFTEEQLIDEAVAFHDFFSVSNSDGKLWVNLNLAETQKGRIYLHSFSGQQLEVREGSFKEKIEFKNQRNSGIHIISLVLDGKRFTKKVIFNN